ncbi:uncharacterized protein LOC126817893 [Patella vulgata]|uniref:uncharacterized protein LOC126817893 n=1 Tax=Patella vulgata TaxID=6465 RepID=UPI0024A834DF|nr:uncharacterized protein LOC126817893 [Patella vulgata]
MHKRHTFGFGSLVNDDYIINPDYKQYQNLFFYMFNWATVGTFKWKYAKGTPENPDYSFAVNAMNKVRKNGLKVRGHNMFWGVPQNVPDFAKQMNGTELNRTIQDRIKFITGLTKGKLEHWDVNNELLHGQYFEETVGDPHYSQKMYKAVHKSDPYARLFLNDYDVLAMGSNTDSYIDQALGFEADKTGLGGIGLQSHFRAFTQPDPTLLKQRLDKLALIGLPLWITELTLEADNEDARADWYEDALRMYFSHPSVHGVIFWGFWDQPGGNAHSSLVNGYNYYINKAGSRYLNLIKNEWSTRVNRNLTSGPKISLRAFMGDYDLTVLYKGKHIHYETFSLDLYKDISIKIHDNPTEITIPPTVDPYAAVTAHPDISHKDEHVVGQASVKPNAGNNLTCETRWSGFSEIGDDKNVWAECPDDKILTGCASVLKDNDWHKDGEEIRMEGGKARCYATNGYRTFGPVQAVARCCKVEGLQCIYKSAGMSDIGIDDEAAITCQNDEFPLGCGSNTWVSSTDGAFPVNKSCIAQNDGTELGVFVTGSCCKAPHMNCEVRWSPASGLLQGALTNVTCQSGWTLTGCSAFSKYGRTAGSFINTLNGEVHCCAVNGGDKYPGEEGVKAVATCCQIK